MVCCLALAFADMLAAAWRVREGRFLGVKVFARFDLCAVGILRSMCAIVATSSLARLGGAS